MLAELQMSRVHPVECNKCKEILYECDIIEGAIYQHPHDEWDIAACPKCGLYLVLGNYTRIEAIEV
jgi:hypothetical protein